MVRKLPQYYVEGTHPAIIEPEMFQMAKKELARQQDAMMRSAAAGTPTSTRSAVCSYAAMMGQKLHRHIRTMGTGEKVASWACAKKITQGTSVCDLPHIHEDVMLRTYLSGIRQIVDQGREVATVVRDGATQTLETENGKILVDIDAKIIEIQESVLELYKKKKRMEVSVADYDTQVQEQSKWIKEMEAQRDKAQDAFYLPCPVSVLNRYS